MQRGFDIGEVWPGIWYEENRQAWTVRNSIMPVPVRTGVAHDHRLRGRMVVRGRGFERARSVPHSRLPTTVRRKQTSRAADDRAPPLERLADALGLRVSYAGDWNLSPEWYGTQSGGWGRTPGETVFTRSSPLSGEVTVTAHEASPLGNERNAEWRVLRFNEKTRQSVVRIADGKADPGCLATEYLKTVVAVIAAVWGARGDTAGTVSPSVLCIGIGGGSIVMFLETFFPEMVVDAVEIDPVVVAAAAEMGFVHPRLFVQDANEFIGSSASNGPYELVYIDAFDGDDRVPEALCGADFAGRLAAELSETGTLVVNLHDNDDVWRRTAKLFADAVGGVAWTCTCRRQGNVVLCVSKVPSLVRAVSHGTYSTASTYCTTSPTG